MTKHPNKRTAIIEAAKKLFACDGFGKTSMDKIASEAGVSKQTIYSHFGSKECLFQKLFPCNHTSKEHTPEAKTQSDLKREAIMQAAERTFVEHGYIATSMDQIALRADVSKQTIYSHFGNKEALFSSVIRNKCEQYRDIAFCSASTSEKAPRDILHELVSKFFSNILQENAMNLLRVIIAESRRDPKLAQAFVENGPRRTRQQFMRYFEEEHRRGRLHAPDAEEAARFITSMFMNPVYLEAMITGTPPSPKEITDQTNLIVDSFMKIYGKKHASHPCAKITVVLAIIAATLTACVTTQEGVQERRIAISKQEAQTRHHAYVRANHYCKGYGSYAFTRKGMDTQTHFVFSCR